MNMDYSPKTIKEDLKLLKFLFPVLIHNLKSIKFFINEIENG